MATSGTKPSIATSSSGTTTHITQRPPQPARLSSQRSSTGGSTTQPITPTASKADQYHPSVLYVCPAPSKPASKARNSRLIVPPTTTTAHSSRASDPHAPTRRQNTSSSTKG